MDPLLHTPLVEAQDGVISRDQLRALGVTDTVIRGWIAHGWLIRRHLGVYAVGHSVLTVAGIRWAAVLAGGPGTVVSHRAAGSELDFWLAGRDVDVISPRQMRQRGIRAHRHRLHPDDWRLTDAGLPVTTVERTLIDLSDVLNERKLRIAYERTRLNRILSLHALDAGLARATGRQGVAKLRRILAEDRPVTATQNDFEAALLALIVSAGLPLPEVNHRTGEEEQLDFRWPAYRLIVETDGGQHERPAQSRRDKRRDARMLAAGWRTVRFSYRDVVDDPAFVIAILRQLLT